MDSFSFVAIGSFLMGCKKSPEVTPAIWVMRRFTAKSLVVNSMLTKKPKQQSYLGSGGSSGERTKKCPDDQGNQRTFQCVGKKNI
jgi:hypothetical protein